MISRYARHEMSAIWSPESRYAIWLEIETLAMEAMGELGTIPKDAVQAYRAKAKFDVARIDEHDDHDRLHECSRVRRPSWSIRSQARNVSRAAMP